MIVTDLVTTCSYLHLRTMKTASSGCSTCLPRRTFFDAKDAFKGPEVRVRVMRRPFWPVQVSSKMEPRPGGPLWR
jgi:hypothetical protein